MGIFKMNSFLLKVHSKDGVQLNCGEFRYGKAM